MKSKCVMILLLSFPDHGVTREAKSSGPADAPSSVGSTRSNASQGACATWHASRWSRTSRVYSWRTSGSRPWGSWTEQGKLFDTIVCNFKKISCIPVFFTIVQVDPLSIEESEQALDVYDFDKNEHKKVTRENSLRTAKIPLISKILA